MKGGQHRLTAPDAIDVPLGRILKPWQSGLAPSPGNRQTSGSKLGF
jgi:hypothetical protein